MSAKSSTNKPLKIVVYSMDGVGHVNSCVGLAEKLQERGHRIVFVVPKVWKGNIEQYRFLNVFLQDSESKSDLRPGERFAQLLLDVGMCGPGNSYEKFYKLIVSLFEKSDSKDSFIEIEKVLNAVIEKHNPDLFILDSFHLPAVVCHSGKPWIRIVSTTPLFFDQFDEVPPSCSGYPLNGDRSKWSEFRKISERFYHCDLLAEVMKEMGYDPYPDNIRFPSTYALSIYGYPAELDYKQLCHYPDNWINVESFMRDSKLEQFEMPQSLINVKDKYPGKLIYLALGSMCAVDVELMKRFVEILSKTKHRYIIAKGPKHKEFELAENMWGDRFLPQIGILPMVDLVITHGGNNTVSESLSHGKPLIIFPFFCDQFENGQRITEVGLGQRLDPYDFEDHQLTDAIDQLLYDNVLHQRLAKISQKILGTDRFKEALDRIEALFD